MLKNKKAIVQNVLDQLWNEELIPFVLTVGEITEDPDECTIHFHDSRIRRAHVPTIVDQPFGELVRAAVLDRVAKMSGPLTDWHP